MEAEISFEKVFEALPDGAYLVDPKTARIVAANRAACDNLGMSRSEVVGNSVLSLQEDLLGLEQWRSMAEEIRRRSPYTFLGRHRRKNGETFSVEIRTTVIEIDGRELFLSSARDVTRRLAVEQSLLSPDERLRYALNEASDGLWDWAICTGQVFFSPQLKRMLGYGPEEMEPRFETWSDNIHPEDAERVLANLMDHVEERRERYEAEYRLRNRNGDYLWVHDRGKVCEWDSDGAPRRAVGMVRNITSQKALEMERSNALVKAKRASRSKSDFLANMSHEFRTPLNSILGFSDAMRLGVFGQLPERYEEYAGLIHGSATHLLELINNVLDMAKIESGKMELNEEVFDFHAMIDDVVSILGIQALSKNVALRNRTLKSLHVFADAIRVRQALLNTIENAIKFTDQGAVEITSESAGSQYRVTIRDTGIGILPDALERVLQPFTQAQDDVLRRRVGGTGLGLSLTRSIMELHGGSLTLESEPDKGTTVTLSFPADRVIGRKGAGSAATTAAASDEDKSRKLLRGQAPGPAK